MGAVHRIADRSYVVASDTLPGHEYPVEYVHGGIGGAWCACISFQRKQHCKHVEAVRDTVAREAHEHVPTADEREASVERLRTIAAIFDR